MYSYLIYYICGFEDLRRGVKTSLFFLIRIFYKFTTTDPNTESHEKSFSSGNYQIICRKSF